jgi:hypothetical protein
MTLQNWKIISKPSQHADSRGWLMDHWPCSRERGKAKKQGPSKLTQWKLNSKAEQLVSYRADPQNLRTHTNSNCHTSLKEELTKQLPLKDRRKTGKTPPNHMVRLRQRLCLNTNIRAGCWRSYTRTTKTKILLFLNLEVFLCVCLFFLFC